MVNVSTGMITSLCSKYMTSGCRLITCWQERPYCICRLWDIAANSVPNMWLLSISPCGFQSDCPFFKKCLCCFCLWEYANFATAGTSLFISERQHECQWNFNARTRIHNADWIPGTYYLKCVQVQMSSEQLHVAVLGSSNSLCERSDSVVQCLTRDRGFEPHRRHCCGPWARHIYPSLVLVQPRMTRPCLTERLLMGRKQSSQTNIFSCWTGNYRPVLMQIDYCTYFKLMGILNPCEWSLVSYFSLLYPVLSIGLRMQIHHFLTFKAQPIFCSRRQFNEISYLISLWKLGKCLKFEPRH